MQQDMTLASGEKGQLITRVSSIVRILMKVFSLYGLWWRSTKQVGVQIPSTAVSSILQEALVVALKLHITFVVPPCPNNV